MSTTIIESLTETRWREHAMNSALRAMSQDGDAVDALLIDIRANSPGASTLQVWPDRLQLMQFLKSQPDGFRTLLPGEDVHIERKQIVPYLGWYSFTWENETVEVVISPTTYITGCAICIGTNAEALHRLSRRLDEFGLWPAGRCLKYARNWQSSPEMDADIGKTTWDDVVVAPEILAGVRDCVQGFYKHRDSFRSLGFPPATD